MNKKQVLQDLSQFISIQSVSADSSRFNEMNKAVTFLKEKLTKMGCEVHVTQDKDKPPLILGILNVPQAQKTIGIYGHYDVQHEEPVGEWNSNPYELTRKNGKLIGRGVADNKGHIMQNIVAVEELIASRSLKNNIIFFIEGEEEIGSERLEGFVEQFADTLSTVDVFFVTDVGMYAKHIPQIIYALRGLVYFEIELKTGNSDLHSGVYGNAALNPIQLISTLFTQMKDTKTGEVLIPGFYDEVRNVSKKEMDLLEKGSISDQEFQKEMQAFTATTMRKVPSFLAPKIFPSLDVHGVVGGYTGEGPKTVIPKSVTAKFSCRLVEFQDVRKIEKLVKLFIKQHIPKGIQYEISTYSYDNPFYCSVEVPFLQKTAAILSDQFSRETVFMREGGSIPVAEIIQRKLKKPVILTGFILPDSNLHAPNENFDEEMFWKGITALKKIYEVL